MTVEDVGAELKVKRNWWGAWAILATVALVAVSTAWIATSVTNTPHPQVANAPLKATATAGFAQGAYVGGGNASGLATFASKTGTSPTIASDYLPSNAGWSGLDGSGGSLGWLLNPWKATSYTLSLGVPMFPTGIGATLATGATGVYNGYYTTLAQTLVAAGQSNAYLRLGWEFDGSWTAWHATNATDEASYAAYFQQIVTTMRAVNGAHFRFVWNPDAGAFTTNGYSVAAAYPGSAYVDVIGLDSYDQTWVTPQTPANAWTSTVLPALKAADTYAASVKEPVALTEWGVIIRSDGHGLGDDPYYVNQMAAWLGTASNNVTFESFFDFNASGLNSAITGGSFPNSLAAFITDFSAAPPPPPTTTTTSTTTPTPPPTTTPTTITPTTLPTTTTVPSSTTTTTGPVTTTTTTQPPPLPRPITCSGTAPAKAGSFTLNCSG